MSHDPIIGLSVLKEFPNYGYFSGVVTDVSMIGKEPQYHIRFTDGDRETVNRNQVIDLLMPNSPCIFSSIKLNGGSNRIIPKYFISNRDYLVIWGKLEDIGWSFECPEEVIEDVIKPGRKKKKVFKISTPRNQQTCKETFLTIETALQFAFASKDGQRIINETFRQTQAIRLSLTPKRKRKLNVIQNNVNFQQLSLAVMNTLYTFFSFKCCVALCGVQRSYRDWCYKKWEEEKEFPLSFNKIVNHQQLLASLKCLEKFPSIKVLVLNPSICIESNDKSKQNDSDECTRNQRDCVSSPPGQQRPSTPLFISKSNSLDKHSEVNTKDAEVGVYSRNMTDKDVIEIQNSKTIVHSGVDRNTDEAKVLLLSNLSRLWSLQTLQLDASALLLPSISLQIMCPLPSLCGLISLQLDHCEYFTIHDMKSLCDAPFMPLLSHLGLNHLPLSPPDDDSSSKEQVNVDDLQGKILSCDDQEEEEKYKQIEQKLCDLLNDSVRGLQSLELISLVLTPKMIKAIHSLRWSLVSLNLTNCTMNNTSMNQEKEEENKDNEKDIFYLSLLMKGFNNELEISNVKNHLKNEWLLFDSIGLPLIKVLNISESEFHMKDIVSSLLHSSNRLLISLNLKGLQSLTSKDLFNIINHSHFHTLTYVNLSNTLLLNSDIITLINMLEIIQTILINECHCLTSTLIFILVDMTIENKLPITLKLLSIEKCLKIDNIALSVLVQIIDILRPAFTITF